MIGVGLFGFTLSWDEIARSSQTMGEHNTLPMELQALTTTVTTPDIYALGTSTTGVSFAVIAVALGAIAILRARQARHGSDAGAGVMRLLVVNPNTTASMTARIGEAARAAAAPGTRFTPSIPTAARSRSKAISTRPSPCPACSRRSLKGEAEGFDAFVIACFDDTGLEAARCVRERAGDRHRRSGVPPGLADRASLQRRDDACRARSRRSRPI